MPAVLSKRVQVLFPPLMWERLQQIAQEQERSVSVLIREAVQKPTFPLFRRSGPWKRCSGWQPCNSP